MARREKRESRMKRVVTFVRVRCIQNCGTKAIYHFMVFFSDSMMPTDQDL